jgi:hypothetical protein
MNFYFYFHFPHEHFFFHFLFFIFIFFHVLSSRTGLKRKKYFLKKRKSKFLMSVVQHAPYNILKSHAFSLPTCPTWLAGVEKNNKKKGRKKFFCGLENKKKQKKERSFFGHGRTKFLQIFSRIFLQKFPTKTPWNHSASRVFHLYFLSSIDWASPPAIKFLLYLFLH